MAEQPVDCVVSYTVYRGGIVDGTDAELKDALTKGYRVVDVLPTVVASAAAENSFVCVTVVLVHPDHAPSKPYGMRT
jgi:hypothetical protein